MYNEAITIYYSSSEIITETEVKQDYSQQRLFQILSKSVHFRRIYSRARRHRSFAP